MRYDKCFYRSLRDLQSQIAPFKDFERIYGSAFKGVAQSVAEEVKLLRGLVPNIHHRYMGAIDLAQREVDRYKQLEATSNQMAEIASAISVVSHFTRDNKSLIRMAEEAIGTSKYWQAELDMYKSFAKEAEIYQLTLKAHYGDVAELSIIAQEHIRQLKWDKIGCTFDITPELISPAISSFSKMIKSYEQLFQSFQEAEYEMASFPPFVSKLPSFEIITGSDFLRTISEEEWEKSPEEVREIEGWVGEDIEASLKDLLAKLDPDIISLWEGAKQSMKSENPDRSRHVIISLREMVTHILHRIASDSDIRSWTADESLYYNGRPTREARLFFICRGLNHHPFQRFVEKDVSAHLELVRILQRGTHELKIDFTNEQLKALVLRTESLLRFLLVIWNSNN